MKKAMKPTKQKQIVKGMKFKDTNPRAKGKRFLTVLSVKGARAQCESHYSNRKSKRMTSTIRLKRLLEGGHRGYEFVG
jgi:hypothetical protein